MQLHSLIDPGFDRSSEQDGVFAIGGRLLTVSLRFRANCRTLHRTLIILSNAEYVASYSSDREGSADDLPDWLGDHRFAKAFGPYFDTAEALGRAIEAIRSALREAAYLKADLLNDLSDPVFATEARARAVLQGYLLGIGHGDYYVAALLDCHNGLRPGCDTSLTTLNAYLSRLEAWAGLRRVPAPAQDAPASAAPGPAAPERQAAPIPVHPPARRSDGATAFKPVDRPAARPGDGLGDGPGDELPGAAAREAAAKETGARETGARETVVQISAKAGAE